MELGGFEESGIAAGLLRTTPLQILNLQYQKNKQKQSARLKVTVHCTALMLYVNRDDKNSFNSQQSFASAVLSLNFNQTMCSTNVDLLDTNSLHE